MEGQTDGWKNGQTDGWKNGQTDGWKNGQTDRWTEERTDGQMNIWKFTPVPYRTSALWGRCQKNGRGYIVSLSYLKHLSTFILKIFQL